MQINPSGQLVHASEDPEEKSLQKRIAEGSGPSLRILCKKVSLLSQNLSLDKDLLHDPQIRPPVKAPLDRALYDNLLGLQYLKSSCRISKIHLSQ